MLAAIVLTAPGLATPATVQAAPLDEVCAELQAEAADFDGRISFVVQDLTDGARCTHNPGEVYATASLYKLIVLAEAHRQQEAGLFSFDEQILGLRASEAARRMIQVSSNDSAHAFLSRLGFGNVAALPGQLGMSNTIIRADADEDHTTTADDIALFFVQLETGNLISPEADEEILELLIGQAIRDRIPALLPANVRIAHKTGRLDLFAHDAGIIYAPRGPYVLVLLTEGSQHWDPGHEAIRQLAALSFTAYAGTPTASPSPTPSAAPSPTPSATPSPTPTATPSPTPSAAPSPTPTAAPSPTPTAAPSPTPTAAPSPAPTATPSAPASVTPADATTRAAASAAADDDAAGKTAAASPSPTPTAGAAAAPGAGGSAAPIDPVLERSDSWWWIASLGGIALIASLVLVFLEMLERRRQQQ